MEQNRSSSLEKKRQDNKDGSGLLSINFDLVTGGQEIEVSILVKF